MPNNELLKQIQGCDRRTLKAVENTPKPIPRTDSAFRKIGVMNPKPRDMNRNVMLSQIETFDTKKLKPLMPEQRYIVSPHDNVSNFMNNARGMGQQALQANLPLVRPVFKDAKQRDAFHGEAQKRLTALGKYEALKDDDSRRNHKTYSQFAEWSTPKDAMTNFSGVNTKRSHPIVYVQGHGSPGKKSISSDAHQSVSSEDVASMLHGMGLPKVSEVRANSCYSGTQHDLGTLPDARNKFKAHSVEDHAGKWGETFAGSLEENLSKLGGNRHNRVRGYLGPTSQNPTEVTAMTPLGKIVKQQHIYTRFGGPSSDTEALYKRGQGSRVSASVPGPKKP